MTEKERIIKMLDRLNKNSTYGLPKEDKKMSDIKPLVVVFDDKFNGIYSGGKWTAWNMCYVPSKIFGDEKECADFFAKESLIFGRGETPEEAIEDLKHRLVYGTHMTKEYIKEVSESTENEEDNEMKATSVQEINNVKEMHLTIEKSSIDGDTKVIVGVSTNDDIFEFHFCGDGCDIFANKWLDAVANKAYKEDRLELVKKNKKLEKEIKKLEHDNMLNKETADHWSKEYYNLSKRFDKLFEDNAELKYQLSDIQVTKEVVEQKLNTTDNVNHPSHYTGKYECIDVMQDVFGDESTNDFCLCNAFKYIWRARKKNGLEDVKKAIWYLNKYLELTETKED